MLVVLEGSRVKHSTLHNYGIYIEFKRNLSEPLRKSKS